MRLAKCMTPAGFNKAGTIMSGQVIETIQFPNTDQVRFLISTGNGSECVYLFLSVDEIAKAVTGAVVDRALEAA